MAREAELICVQKLTSRIRRFKERGLQQQTQYVLTCPECGHQMEVGNHVAVPSTVKTAVYLFLHERGTGFSGKYRDGRSVGISGRF
jgi:hypothetical protein